MIDPAFSLNPKPPALAGGVFTQTLSERLRHVFDFVRNPGILSKVLTFFGVRIST